MLLSMTSSSCSLYDHLWKLSGVCLCVFSTCMCMQLFCNASLCMYVHVHVHKWHLRPGSKLFVSFVTLNLTFDVCKLTSPPPPPTPSLPHS